MSNKQRDRKRERRVPDMTWFLMVRCDPPGLLVITNDHVCAISGITVDTQILSSAVPDAEEAFTSIFGSPLRTRSVRLTRVKRLGTHLLIGAFMDRISDHVPTPVSLERAWPMNNMTIINALQI
jgi:hypothetical protein